MEPSASPYSVGIPEGVAREFKIDRPEEISPTLKKALTMQGPVIVGVPVDYRDNHRLTEVVHPEALNCSCVACVGGCLFEFRVFSESRAT